MRFLRLPLIFVVVAMGLAAVGRPSVTTAERSSAKPCTTFTGPRFADASDPSMHGTKYQIYTHKYSCSEALSYVRKLVTHKVYKKYGVDVYVNGGPKGWTCTANPSTRGLAWRGQCAQNPLSRGPNFNWAGMGVV